MSIELQCESSRRVRIVRGPFAGVVGTARQSDASSHRLLIDVEILGTAFTVEMDTDWLVDSQ